MSVLDKTYPASYDGVPFLVEVTRLAGGIKHVKHEFPNSNNQNIENLGRKVKIPTLVAFINNDTLLDDYYSKRDALITALDNASGLKLIHPFLGHLENIIAVDWDMEESFGELGKATFTITFERTTPQSVPKVSSSTLSQVQLSQTNCITAISSDLSTNFTSDFSKTLTSAIGKVQDLVEDFEEATDADAVPLRCRSPERWCPVYC